METIFNLPSRYTIISNLGKGGIGQVYKVNDSIHNHIVALKVINRAEAQSKETLIREFKILSNFQHPNLVRVYNFGFLTSDIPYFTMEYINGSDLRVFLASEANLSFIHQIIKDILSALCYLHEKGTIHGDIKPENIMIIREAEHITVKLLDFGLATHLGQKHDGISGTLRFLAPEILSSKMYSDASDLYALGLTLIESITNKDIPPHPRTRDDFFRSMYSHLLKIFSNFEIKNPSSLTSFIFNLSQLNLEDRPQSSKEALQAISLLSEEADNKPTIAFEEIFVGRKKELNAINNAIKNIESSKKSLIIEGLQGIGKKSILRKAAKKAQIKGYLVLDLFDDKYKNNPLDHFIADVTNNLPEEKSKAFKAVHENLVTSNLKEGNSYSRVSKTDHTLVIFDNIAKYLHELSLANSVLICIPDIERFSEDFLRFISHLVHEIRILESRILLIVSRNTNIPFKYDAYNTISKESVSSTISVQPFTQQEVISLIKEYFGSIIFSDSEINELILRTHCVPLLIVELIRHLLSSRTIEWSSNQWNLHKSAYNNTYIPENIEEFIINKLKELSIQEKYVLQVIAIYNEQIHFSLIQKIINANINIDKIIQLLKEKQLIKIINGNIIFVHPIYYQYISKNTTSRNRKEINRTIATFCSNEFPNNHKKIAHHYIEAKITDKGINHGLRSADEMISKHEFYNAYNLLVKIYNLAAKSSDNAQINEIYKRLAPIEQKTGHPVDSISHYKHLADNVFENSYKALYIKQIAMIQSDILGHTEDAISHFYDALEKSRSSSSLRLESEILLELGSLVGSNGLSLTKQAAEIAKDINDNLYVKALSCILYLSEFYGITENIETTYTRIEDLIDDVDLETKKDILLNLYMFHFYRGDYEIAQNIILKKIKIEDQTDDPIRKIYSLSSLGGIYYVNGDFFKQLQILKDALLIARKYNSYLITLILISNMLIAYRFLADYKKSFKLLEQANSIITENNIKKLFSTYLLKPTHLFLMFGEKMENEYVKYIKKTKTRAKEFNNTIALGHCYLMHSKYYFQKLNFKIAHNNCTKALELFTNSNDRDDMVDAYAHIGLYLIEAGDKKGGLQNVQKAESIYNEIHCKYLEPFLLFTKGAAERANNLKSAEATLTQALRTSKKMGTRETTWQIQREIALYYMDKEKLGKALSFYKDAIETIKQITESIEDETLKMSYLSVPFRKRVFDEIRTLKQQLK